MPDLYSIPVITGLAFPYFPPRPISGTALNATTIPGYVARHEKEFLIQPKLNGDRVLVLIKDGQVYFANRHGSFFKFNVENKSALLRLTNLTVLDGEVKNKMFDPFEVVVGGGRSLMRECPAYRASHAAAVASIIGRPYLFNPVTQEWIDQQAKVRERVPVWEGVVRKRLGSPYLQLASISQRSTTWVKNKY